MTLVLWGESLLNLNVSRDLMRSYIAYEISICSTIYISGSYEPLESCFQLLQAIGVSSIIQYLGFLNLCCGYFYSLPPRIIVEGQPYTLQNK